MSPDVGAVVGFRVGERAFALPLADLAEILKVPVYAEVPRAPPGVLGVFIARGAAITLLDARPALGGTTGPYNAHARVLLVHTTAEDLGLLVDAVTGVHPTLPEPRDAPSGTQLVSLGALLADMVTGMP